MATAYGLSNCIGWYQSGVGVYSDAGTTPANNGDGVYQWSDQSGSGNHLTQSTSTNRPIYNTYTTAVTSSGASSVAPYGAAISLYQATLGQSLLFDGTNSYLNMPSSLTLANTGCTVVMCTRGSYYCPISFGSDGVNQINYGWVGGSPQRMSIVNGGYRNFPAVSYLPFLTPIVHGIRCSAALTESRLYMGTNQNSALPANYCNFAMTGGAVGRLLGASIAGYGNYSFDGEISEIAIFSSPLTDTMMQSLLSNMQTANRIRSDANTNQVVFVGDSLTAGGPGIVPMSHCYPWVLCQQYGGTFKPLMVAAPGATIAQEQSLVTSQVQTLDLTPFAVNVAIVCCGSNDLSTGRTATQVQTDLATLCSGLRAAGFKVILATITLRTNGVGSSNAALNAAFNTVNAGLRTTYSSYADALVDWANDSRLSDPTNTTYFVDDIHTTPAGDSVKAALVKTALDSLLAPPSTSQATLNYASFYAGGKNFAGSFGNFVRT